jgi:myosin heavy subunit
LEEFSEGAVLHQIRERYKRDSIYTFIGNILVSVNPFKHLAIYVNGILVKYKDRTKLPSLEPHIFATASNAYNSLMTEGLDQSVVISGESGAGKTEATKLVLMYLGEVAGSASGVEQQIMLSNPILEAFGNSKTLRNNNSSRFGKWMEIQFDKSGKIIGAQIVNYLLEKSRVVGQATNERNYHSFFQMCAGVSADLREKFKIWSADQFSYLNSTGCLSIQGVNDAADFAEVLKAMEKLKFTKDETDQIVQILAAILHLGNLRIAAKEGDLDASVITNKDQLGLVSSIVGLTPEALETAICFRSVTIRKEVQMIKLKLEQATDSRDSLAKALYGNMFDWIVKRVNDFLSSSAQKAPSIGVLDIFGFEVFDRNSFEQYCINFANEQLQAHFNDYIFKMEQEEYKAEEIDADQIVFIDNSETLTLIRGIIEKYVLSH